MVNGHYRKIFSSHIALRKLTIILVLPKSTLFKGTSDSQEPVFRGSTPGVLLDDRVERVIGDLDKAEHQRLFSGSASNLSFLLIIQTKDVYLRKIEVQDEYLWYLVLKCRRPEKYVFS